MCIDRLGQFQLVDENDDYISTSRIYCVVVTILELFFFLTILFNLFLRNY